MEVLTRIRGRAKESRKNICLAESFDDRVIEAADLLLAEGIADVTLIGKAEEISARAKRLGLDLSAAHVIDPASDAERDDYVNTYCELRKHKSMTRRQAAEAMSQHIYYAAMCVRKRRCDGMVGGSVASSPDLIRAMLQVIRPKEGIKTVSSFFVMVTKVRDAGVDGALIYSDAGLVPDPTTEMLVDIAAASAESCRLLLETEPVVAFLSFSTKGSTKHPLVEKVIAAAKLFKERFPDVRSDGELQLDAAIVPAVAQRKCGDSEVAGRCNVLIFPDLNAGNIGYKLTERLGGAQAIGPLVQGLARPGNDLSRGCRVMDIVNAAAVASLQAAATD